MTEFPPPAEPAGSAVTEPAAGPAVTTPVPPARTPVHAQAVRLYGTHLAGDRAELYRSMRARFGGVAPILLDGEVPGWFVLGYRELHVVTSNPQLFARDCRRWNQWDRVPADWPLMPFVGWTPSVMFAEGSDHQRRAGAIGDALDAVDRTELRAICEQVADALIDQFAGIGEADLLVVMAAAQQPTANWIGNTLRLMLIDDQFSLTLQGGRSSADQALNEVLWKDTPTQNFIGRFAVQDCELGGHRIRRGDLLVLGLAAANVDPQVHPPSFADSGSNRAHMSFGHGEHGCPFPAPELAEVIAKAAVEVLLDRIPDVQLGVTASSLEWRPSLWMRGLFALPVTFSPVAHFTPVSG